jgi:hypothetical protein
LTGQAWNSELAALSWNLLVVFVALSLPDDANGDDISDVDPQFPGGRFDEFDPRNPYSATTCSYANPILCKNVSSLLALTGTTKNTVKAGGNERFGRRDFQWHGGSSVALHYEKRNILGFSTDFAEDRTRTSWGIEFTWFEGVPVTDLDAFDALARVDPLNLVISVDRPTFINFLNRNRTFFFNSQVFFQYLVGYDDHLATNGPFNARATFTVSTGYYQDRMLPSFTWVHDFPSQSGGVLPSLTWRFSESHSVTLGANIFYGRVQQYEAALVPRGGLAGGAGKGAYHTYIEEGLSTLRERDEIYLRMRMTFERTRRRPAARWRPDSSCLARRDRIAVGSRRRLSPAHEASVRVPLGQRERFASRPQPQPHADPPIAALVLVAEPGEGRAGPSPRPRGMQQLAHVRLLCRVEVGPHR